MHWLNLHISTLDSEEFVSSGPLEQATWLKLLRYCIGQENAGVIQGANSWTDRQWQHVVRVKKKEVQRESRLWKWDGDGIVRLGQTRAR